MKKIFASLALVSLLAGCASSGPIDIGNDTYMLTDSSAMTYSGDVVAVSLIKEGTAFCTSQGKNFELIKKDPKGYVPFVRSAQATIEFRCVEKH